MDITIRTQILNLIHREVLPATGCTEPVAVALCAAGAAELLGKTPDRIEVYLSANILKNAMGVGIPGTGMTGLPIAIALGALIARPECRLQILQDITPLQLEEGKRLVQQKNISIHLKENVDKLYIETLVFAENLSARAIICRDHTCFVYKERNGKVLFDELACKEEDRQSCKEKELTLSFDRVYRFATEISLEEIRFIKQSSEINKEAAAASLKHNYGHTVGKIVGSEQGKKYMGDSAFTRMLVVTAAACDARMDGAMIPVTSNSGSGNQGIAATLPVLSFAGEIQCSEEQLIRALTLSHLMVIYIKQSLGRLSALCGCV
ncbi:MAG: L-serine ammonia-lyase, iron-sulfur-dependent, subunit alpha, partial [Tannerellaceae bacterium]|nr:L-serine ammonia-lyase, iron-sulfur-dependent, subunit alpha [Tannerellaceae bacterium]